MLVQQFLEQSATNSPGKTALICGASRYSYLEIDWAANAFSRGLLDDGFQRQDRAVIYLENSLEAVVAIFGVLKVGGIFAVIDAQVKARKLESILSNSEATTLITSHHLLAQVSDVVAGADSLQRIIIPESASVYHHRSREKLDFLRCDRRRGTPEEARRRRARYRDIATPRLYVRLDRIPRRHADPPQHGHERRILYEILENTADEHHPAYLPAGVRLRPLPGPHGF
jgi:acyl-CoA synthetase (AMP-forming)/AMP-acid ligase II